MRIPERRKFVTRGWKVFSVGSWVRRDDKSGLPPRGPGRQDEDADCLIMAADPSNPDSASDAPSWRVAGHDMMGLLELGLRKASGSAHGDWAPLEPAELEERLPGYRIEELVGRGGMGAVYRAVQIELERTVAIKLLPETLAENKEFVTRFRREARMLAKLDHPGIVRVHDFGQTTDGHLFFVMEFIDGTDLHRALSDGPLGVEQSLDIAIQLCAALDYAHGQGVIHRDLKPANVLLGLDGRARIVDFGLARPLEGADGCLTLSGAVMGTPEYMAPEQRHGEGDQRSDLYALGVMLYEMLSGRPPQGAWQAASKVSGADVRTDRLITTALQGDPDARYRDAKSMARDLMAIRGGVGGSRRLGKPWVSSAAVIVLAAVAFAAMRQARNTGSNKPAAGVAPSVLPGIALPLVNPSFENPARGDGTFTTGGWLKFMPNPQALAGWSPSTPFLDIGVENPRADRYPQHLDGIADPLAHGSQYAYINTFGAGQAASLISHAPGRIRPGREYHLSVAVGHGMNIGAGTYRMELLGNGKVLASAETNGADIVPGRFRELVTRYQAPASGEPAGAALQVRLTHFNATGSTRPLQGHFDSVRLHESSGSAAAPTTEDFVLDSKPLYPFWVSQADQLKRQPGTSMPLRIRRIPHQRYYAFGRINGTWDDAVELARSVGARLVTVDSEEEDEWIRQVMLAPSERDVRFFIGATCEKAGEWKWENGEPMIYQNWSGDAGSVEDGVACYRRDPANPLNWKWEVVPRGTIGNAESWGLILEWDEPAESTNGTR